MQQLPPPPQQQQQSCSRRYFGSGGGSRGSRGHGWWVNYRAGKGGRHLQGEYFEHLDLDSLQKWNDAIFSLGSTKVFMDIKMEPATATTSDNKKDDEKSSDIPIHRLNLELATAVLPKATENFMKLIKAEVGTGYTSTTLHRVEKKVGITGGLIYKPDGSLTKSVPVGKCHPDFKMDTSFSNMDVSSEHLVLSHIPGVLTMLSPRVHEIDSRFMLCTHHSPHLDGQSVAIGRLADESSLEIVQNWEGTLITQKGQPTNVVLRIVKCGVLEEKGSSASHQSTVTSDGSAIEGEGKKVTESQ
jgi:cyclophilin family peptidyl-prolyl cis-trans isomerase